MDFGNTPASKLTDRIMFEIAAHVKDEPGHRDAVAAIVKRHVLATALVDNLARKLRGDEVLSDSGWVIETGGNPLLYWNGRAREAWTPRHDDAVRFARFDDAERVRCWLVPNGTTMARSVEHVWCAAAARPTAGVER